MTDIEENDSEDYPARRFTGRTIRQSTRLEVGLALLLASMLVAVVTFGVQIRESVNSVREDVGDALQRIEQIQQQAPELAVLRYRVTQLEALVTTLSARR
jgi:hypothetical protein